MHGPHPVTTHMSSVVVPFRRPVPTLMQIADDLYVSIASVGLISPVELIIEHGKTFRFVCHEKRKSKDGWYVVYVQSTHTAGKFGSWRTRSAWTWKYPSIVTCVTHP